MKIYENKKTSFGPGFGPNFAPKNFFRGCYLYQMLENGDKPNLGSNFS